MGEGQQGCLPDDYSVSPIMGCHLLSRVHKGKGCARVRVRVLKRKGTWQIWWVACRLCFMSSLSKVKPRNEYTSSLTSNTAYKDAHD